MKTTQKLFAAIAVLSLISSACTASKENVRSGEVKVGGPQVTQGDGSAAKDEPKISRRAQLLFEDAVQLSELQQKANKTDYPALEKKFEAALKEDSNLAEADYNLGVLKERQGKKQEAVAHYQSALRKKPTLKQAALNLAVMMQNDGDVGGAVEIYKKILASFPDDGSARARLAEIYLAQGDHDRAMQLAREALIREPKTLTAYKVMMRSNLDRGQLSMARLVALRAMKLDENDPELYYTVGQIFLKEKSREKAMLQFKRSVEVAPNFLPAHVVLAKMAMENEDYAGAEEHLRKILQADAKNAAAHVDLGVAYKGMGQFDKALQEYEVAEKLDPELPAIYLNKGVIIHRYKDGPEKGIELYKKYIALSGTVSSEAQVFKLIDEAQNVIKQKEDEQRAIAEAAKMEAEMKAAEEEAKRLEEQAKRDAAKDQMAKDAAGAETKPASADGSEKGKAEAKPASDKKPVEEKTPAPAPKAAPKPASDEPGDEPADNF